MLDAAVTRENFLVIDTAEKAFGAVAHEGATASQAVARTEWLGHAIALARDHHRADRILGQWRIAKDSGYAVIGAMGGWSAIRRRGRNCFAGDAGLRWLASHHDALMALTNLKTLAWVVQAAGVFQDENAAAPASMVAIAEKLWSHWTEDRMALAGVS